MIRSILSWHRAREARKHAPIVLKPDHAAVEMALLRQDVRDLERAGDMSILLMEFDGLDAVMAQPRPDDWRPGLLRRTLHRLADWITQDARAEHEQTQQPDGFVFRSRATRHPNDEAMPQSARAMAGPDDEGAA
jgi:hypothetical protein